MTLKYLNRRVKEIYSQLLHFFLIYLFLPVFRGLSKPNNKKRSLLLFRVDAIGDYILFRNYIEVLSESPKYFNFDITLLGNVLWKDLAESLDESYVNNFIWFDRKKYDSDPLYKFSFLLDLSKVKYTQLIHPAYSREELTDNVVRLIHADKKIGCFGDHSNIKPEVKIKTDSFYTNLLPASNEIVFEYYRYREFFENLLEQKIVLKKPLINDSNIQQSLDLPANYVTIVPGAGFAFRQWSAQNFSIVAEDVSSKYGYDIIIVGSGEEHSIAEQIKRVNSNFINLAGKISLVQLLEVISKSRLVIANETSAIHISVAVGTEAICISNANHFGRFNPYPREITDKISYIYPPELENPTDKFDKMVEAYSSGSDLDINTIEPLQVLEVLKLKLNVIMN